MGQGSGWNAHENRTTEIDRSMPLGRWPANLILVHKPGCRQDGTRRVLGRNGGGMNRSGTDNVVYGKASGHPKVKGVGYADEDGTETVPSWDCTPDCPVAALDEQTGTSVSNQRAPTGKAIYPIEGVAVTWNANSVMDVTERGYSDSGGASRFFKQVRSGT